MCEVSDDTLECDWSVTDCVRWVMIHLSVTGV